jgi:tartrate dehydrogenase/decarboxylase / D-malate dehydrogenase
MKPAPRVFEIAVIPGDGIGGEVIGEGVRVLDRVAELSGGDVSFNWVYFPWGCGHYLETGMMMDGDGLTRLQSFDAIYFGAVGWPTVPDHISLWGLRLAICQGFDQYANVRPVRLLPGVKTPLRTPPPAMEWVVVRENTEGEYAGLGGRNLSGRGPGREIALQTSVFTEEGCERIMRFAFNLARTRRRKKVTSVTKSNAQQYGMVLWDEVFHRVAREYPDVETDQGLVDAMAARFVLRPESLEVVVASNLFADILSDLGGALAGGLGMAASANLNPERRHPSMFEPVHGSAPDIAGKGIANPIGAIWSAALMLEHLGLADGAARVMQAIIATSSAGEVTPDIGGRCTTRQVGDAIVARLSGPLESSDR